MTHQTSPEANYPVSSPTRSANASLSILCADIVPFPNGIARESAQYEPAQDGAGELGASHETDRLVIHSDLEAAFATHNPAPNNSVRSVQPSTLPTRLTVTRGDKAQSPFHIACGLLLPRWQWASGHRVLRSRSLSIFRATLISLALLTTPSQAGVSTSCLPRSLKTKLAYIERHFGRVEVISAYRKNAVIAGTRKRSKHSYCGAVDFHVHGNRKAAIQWLWKQRGEVILYSGHFHHIHIADGNWKGWKR